MNPYPSNKNTDISCHAIALMDADSYYICTATRHKIGEIAIRLKPWWSMESGEGRIEIEERLVGRTGMHVSSGEQNMVKSKS
ncbi:MAG: hypothetical protein AMK69_04510 [Nitrospira bacterium SG8_3]|nr:MAG: hypothetical protein AMK69_04510 [Nitrospira bacterium SG8_3]